VKLASSRIPSLVPPDGAAARAAIVEALAELLLADIEREDHEQQAGPGEGVPR
jgi:hypothetical protein